MKTRQNLKLILTCLALLLWTQSGFAEVTVDENGVRCSQGSYPYAANPKTAVSYQVGGHEVTSSGELHEVLPQQTTELKAMAKKYNVTAGELMAMAANAYTKQACQDQSDCRIFVHRTGSSSHEGGSTLLYYIQLGNKLCGMDPDSNNGYDGWYNVESAANALSSKIASAVPACDEQICMPDQSVLNANQDLYNKFLMGQYNETDIKALQKANSCDGLTQEIVEGCFNECNELACKSQLADLEVVKFCHNYQFTGLPSDQQVQAGEYIKLADCKNCDLNQLLCAPKTCNDEELDGLMNQTVNLIENGLFTNEAYAQYCSCTDGVAKFNNPSAANSYAPCTPADFERLCQRTDLCKQDTGLTPVTGNSDEEGCNKIRLTVNEQPVEVDIGHINRSSTISKLLPTKWKEHMPEKASIGSFSGSNIFELCQGDSYTGWPEMVAQIQNGGKFSTGAGAASEEGFAAHFWRNAWVNKDLQSSFSEIKEKKAACIELKKKMKQVEKAYEQTGDTATYNYEMANLIKEEEELMPDLALQVENTLGQLESTFNQINRCASLLYLSSYKDFGKSHAGEETSKKSHDGLMECHNYGYETQDYDACVAIIDIYDVAMVLKQGVETGTEINETIKTTETQTELMATPVGDREITDTLEAQKDSIDRQSTYAATQAGLSTTEALALVAALNAMPDRQKLIDSCSTNVFQRETPNVNEQGIILGKNDYYTAVNSILKIDLAAGEADVTGATPNPFKSYQPGADYVISGLVQVESEVEAGAEGEPTTSTVTSRAENPGSCHYVAHNGGALLLRNAAIEGPAKSAAAAAGLEAAELGTKALLLAEQSNKVDDLIDDLTTNVPTPLPTAAGAYADATVNCLYTPNDPRCASGFERATTHGFSGNNINFSGGSPGSAAGYQLSPDSENALSAAPDTETTSETAKDPAMGIGTVADRGGTKASGGFEGGMPSAATVGQHKPGTFGGTSGGGGGISGVGGTGGGSRAAASRGRGNFSRQKGKSYNYSGGGKGFLSYRGSGGSSKKSRKSKKVDNPFTKLFGKKKGANDKDINFRDLASKGSIGTKDGKSIFDMISNRYKVVDDKDRLLKYDKVK